MGVAKSQFVVTTRLLFLLLIFSSFVKLFHIGYRSFFLDELYGVVAGLEKSSSIFFEEWVNYDNSPPLYYILLRLWLQVVPADETGARSLSTIFVILASFIFVNGVRKRFKSDIWIYLGLLVSCNYAFLYFAQEARAYALLLLITCCQLLYFIDLITISEAAKGRKALVFFSIFSVLSAYTHYSGAFFTAILFSFLFYDSRNNWKYLKSKLIALAACLLVGIPWLPYFVVNMGVEKFQVSYSLSGLVKMFIPMLCFGNTGVGKALCLLFLLLIAYLLFRKRNSFSSKNKLEMNLFILTAISCLIVLLFPFFTPMRTYRHYIVFVPLILLSFSFLIATSKFEFNKILLIVGGLFILGWQMQSHYKSPREEWRQAVEYLVEKNENTNAVAIVLGEPWIKSSKEYLIQDGEWTYMKIRRPLFYNYYLKRFDPRGNIKLIVLSPNSPEIERYIADALKNSSKIFLLSYTGDLPYGMGSFELSTNFRYTKKAFMGHEVFCITN